jgi:hypothetical protein
MIAFIKRTLASLDFKYQRQQKEWHEHLDRRDAAESKARRLAEIARDRNALKEKLAKAVRDKKARQPILKKLRELTNEEIRLDLGR